MINRAIVGPTASGKTSLAIKIAKKENLSIINSDSRQFWPLIHLPASPTEKEKKEVPHLLYGNLPININPSLGWWINNIPNLNSRCFVGGTIFYIHSLIQGIPRIEISIKNKKKASNINNPWWYLNNINPSLVSKIHPNDNYRVRRKLEFFLETGTFFENYPEKYKIDLQITLLNPSMEILEKRIKQRISENFPLYIEEVKIWRHDNLYKILGYEECLDFILGKINKEDTIKKIEMLHIQYAKKQKKMLKKIEPYAKEIICNI